MAENGRSGRSDSSDGAPTAKRSLGSPIEVRDALLIAFFATFLVAARAALRWHLHVPGHSMLPAAFALVLVRSCVDRRVAASLCGVLAGIAIAGLGMGRGGPILALKLVLPGAVVDLGALIGGGSNGAARISLPTGAALGALAGATGFVPVVLVEGWAGVEPAIIVLHATIAGGSKALFGAIGGWAGAWVAQELRHHGVIAT